MKVGVVGLGYVGLPLAVAFAERECDVVALDTDQTKTNMIAAGESYVEDVTSDRLRSVLRRIAPTTRYDDLKAADAVLICVPTPLNENREPELSHLRSCAASLARVLRRDQLVVLESTTYPGTTRGLMAEHLSTSGLEPGTDFQLAFSPERIDPGNAEHTLRSTPKLVGGLTPACTERAVALYEIVCETVLAVSSPEVAEFTKLLENTFRAVNIALVNELAIVASGMGIDIWEVLDAAASKPYGFTRFDPGPGVGGHCLPIDPIYLSWHARSLGLHTEFIDLATKVNERMPHHCVSMVQRALNDAGRPLNGSRISVFGVSYKSAIADTRESAATKVIKLLQAHSACVCYHDPYVPNLPEAKLSSVPFEEALNECDAAVIATAHPDVDHHQVATHVSTVIDLRGALRSSVIST